MSTACPHQAGVGVVVGSEFPVTRLPALSERVEQLGFDQLWYSEVAAGGVAGAAIALHSTKRLHVATGVVGLAMRHPAQLAMEVSTLAAVWPHRFRLGVGLGAPGWLRQLGVLPRSPLSFMKEGLSILRALLAGESLTLLGETYQVDNVRLGQPVDVPIDLAAVGPQMLRLSGAIADGTILSVMATPQYIEWARAKISEGQHSAGRDAEPHRVTALALLSVDDDEERARQAVRAPLAEHLLHTNAITDQYGISADVRRMVAEVGPDSLAASMPERWIDDLSVTGTPAQCRRRVQQLQDAGADHVGLLAVDTRATEAMLAKYIHG